MDIKEVCFSRHNFIKTTGLSAAALAMPHMCHYAVHTPLQAKPDIVARYKAKTPTNQKNPVYAAMVESVNQAVGEIMSVLDELDLAERTVVIFTSDTGGLAEKAPWDATDNAPLRTGKGHPYEGGIRVAQGLDLS